ncbi:MAG: hypothetical protein WC069_01135 [Candidatus Shapirobacteria bacterium]
MTKKIKTNITLPSYSYIKVPVPAVIFTVVLLIFLSFYSGLSFAKSKTTLSTGPVIDSKISFAPTKFDKPELKFFVMSFCPYGNQIEDVLRPIFDLLGSKVDITPHYIFDKIDDVNAYCKSRNGDATQCSTYVQNKYFTSESECKKVITDNVTKCKDTKAYIQAPSGTLYASLHGRQEATQNIREMCVWNMVGNNKKQWWDFIGAVNKNCSAQNADSCWEDQAKQVGLDTAAITDCFNKDGINLIEKELAITKQFSVTGSPTVLINDQIFPPEAAYSQDGQGNIKIGNKVATQDKYRTPNVIKEALCVGSKSTIKECKTILNELSGSAPAAGGCGN